MEIPSSLYAVLSGEPTRVISELSGYTTVTESVESADNDRASALHFNSSLTLP